MNIKRELYRDQEKGRVAGVCAGLAEYFGWELWLVRIIFVSGFLLTGGSFFFVGYVVAWFILDKSQCLQSLIQKAKKVLKLNGHLIQKLRLK